MARTPRPPALTGIVVLLAGAVLLGGGTWLAILGGSWYYVGAGALLLATGGLLVRGRAEALAVYAIVLVATLGWSLWEAGRDGWPLAARGDVLVVLGLWLLMPWVRRGLDAQEDWRRQRRPRGPALLLASALALFGAIAAASWMHDPHALAGSAPPPIAPTAVDRPLQHGDWHACGCTAAGRRHSPLTPLTQQNVAGLELAWQHRTGDIRSRPGEPVETRFEATPL